MKTIRETADLKSDQRILFYFVSISDEPREVSGVVYIYIYNLDSTNLWWNVVVKCSQVHVVIYVVILYSVMGIYWVALGELKVMSIKYCFLALSQIYLILMIIVKGELNKVLAAVCIFLHPCFWMTASLEETLFKHSHDAVTCYQCSTVSLFCVKFVAGIKFKNVHLF